MFNVFNQEETKEIENNFGHDDELLTNNLQSPALNQKLKKTHSRNSS